MEWTVDGYNIFAYNKNENMIPTISLNGSIYLDIYLK